MFGIFLDVTQRKQAEEANELLAGEMSHRMKNLLQIATALTQMTSRSAATKEDMAQELTNRLMALGRAQELVRAVPGGKNEATLLGDLISILSRRMTRRELPSESEFPSLRSTLENGRARRSLLLSMSWQLNPQSMEHYPSQVAR